MCQTPRDLKTEQILIEECNENKEMNKISANDLVNFQHFLEMLLASVILFQSLAISFFGIVITLMRVKQWELPFSSLWMFH